MTQDFWLYYYKKGADLNKTNWLWCGTLLYKAAEKGDVNMVRLLLEYEANPLRAKKKPALEKPFELAHFECLELLLEHDAQLCFESVFDYIIHKQNARQRKRQEEVQNVCTSS